MNICAIDTSTETLVIALMSGTGSRASFTLNAGYKHGELLVPEIERLLSATGIAASAIGLVVCASGPGSFTGLRIGIATAKGIAFGAGCPIVCVSSLDAIAHGLNGFQGTVVPVIDARKKRFYSARYRNGKRTSEFMDIPASDFPEWMKDEGTWILSGPAGRQVFDEIGPSYSLDENYATYDPFHLISVGLDAYARNPAGCPESEGPLYLRKSEAELGIGRPGG